MLAGIVCHNEKLAGIVCHNEIAELQFSTALSAVSSCQKAHYNATDKIMQKSLQLELRLVLVVGSEVRLK